jgi:hypothetical protein
MTTGIVGAFISKYHVTSSRCCSKMMYVLYRS